VDQVEVQPVYVLEADQAGQFWANAAFDEPDEGLPLSIGKGGAPTESTPLVVCFERRPRRWSHLFPVLTARLASRTLRERVDAHAPGAVQWVPVVLEVKRAPREDYFLMNVLDERSCIDLDASEYTEWKGVPVRMRHLVLVEAARRAPPPLCLSKPFALTLVAPALAEALRDLPGVRLMPAEGWSDAHRY
jgi:hypothetical protein